MKRFLFLFLVLLFTEALADFSNTISWQGVLVDNSGKALNGTFNINVFLYDSESGGQAVWSETYPSLIIENGLVNLQLGSISALNVSFNKPYWLEIKVNDEAPLSRIPLSAVPYAMYSQKTSNEITGEALILKDKDGNDRIKLDPDNGSFQMISDDTVWYEIQVKSPPSFVTKNGDGTTRILDLSTGIAKTYSKENKLLFQEESRTSNNDDFYQDKKSKTYFDDNGKEKHTESKYFFYDKKTGESNKHDEISFWNKDGERISEITYIKDGKTIIEKYIDGYLWIDIMDFLENDKNEQYSETKLFDENGDVISKNRNYFENNRTDVIDKDDKGTSLEQTINELLFSLLNSNGAFSTKPIIYDESNKGFRQSYIENGEEIAYTEYRKHQNRPQVFTKGEQVVLGDQVIAGNSSVNGNLNVQGTKNFKIEHPSDNSKFLVHASVESNEPLNTYSGNVVTDDIGIAVVHLPDYFDKINLDFRYQLTVIGQFAQAIIHKEIKDNAFEIKTNKPNVKVSWQITARRNDNYIRQNPFKDIIDK